MSKTVTLQELRQSFELGTAGTKFAQDIASYADSGLSKSLSIVAEFSGFHDGRIVWAQIYFRVIVNWKPIIQTDDLAAAVEVYNQAE